MAKVKYTISASLKGHHNKVHMKYKQVLMIREGASAAGNLKQTSENQITTWCCANQGTSRIEVEFEKNVFEPSEVCRAFVRLDNSHCNVRLENVRLAVEQQLNIRADGRTFNRLFTLTDKSEGGVPARHGTVE